MKTLRSSGIIVVLVLLSSGSLFADPRDGPEGYWTFDESSGGILHDFSGHGHNGTLVNFPGGRGNWTSGQAGGALLFGGPSTREYVSVPNFGMPITSMTLTAWVWANSTPNWATIAANWSGG